MLDRNVNIGNQSFPLEIWLLIENLSCQYVKCHLNEVTLWEVMSWSRLGVFGCSVCEEGVNRAGVCVCGVRGSPGGTDGSAEPGVHLRRVLQHCQ